MSDAQFEVLMRAAYLQTFPAQLDLIREGDRPDFLFVVIEGCVELYARSNGREATMGHRQPGEHLHPRRGAEGCGLSDVRKDARAIQAASHSLPRCR